MTPTRFCDRELTVAKSRQMPTYLQMKQGTGLSMIGAIKVPTTNRFADSIRECDRYVQSRKWRASVIILIHCNPLG